MSESDENYDVEMIAVRILGLLICRGEVRDKATYLFGLLFHDLDPKHNENFNESSLKSSIELATAIFPNAPVAIGDKWAKQTTLKKHVTLILTRT